MHHKVFENASLGVVYFFDVVRFVVYWLISLWCIFKHYVVHLCISIGEFASAAREALSAFELVYIYKRNGLGKN